MDRWMDIQKKSPEKNFKKLDILKIMIIILVY